MKTIEGNLIDIHSESIYPVRINIENGFILDIVRVQENFERFILPGFVDAHIHIESSLLVPEKFADVALTHGTIATVSDPHEIANVCGMEGVNFMVKSGDKSNLKFFWNAPSCVPATNFETSGATLSTSDIESLIQNEKIVALGEMMNYPGIIFQDKEAWEKCNIIQKYSKVIDGHAPGVSGEPLKKYISAGISTDHECSTLKEALEKIELGMKILIREGSSAKNFEALHPLLVSHPEKVMLCSDDLHADDLLKGHINLLVIKAIRLGIPLFNVLKSVSLNPVKHYNLPVGLLRIGDPADFILADSLKKLNILETWINGEMVFNVSEKRNCTSSSLLINHFNATLVQKDELEIIPGGSKVNVIGVEEGSISTSSNIFTIPKGKFEELIKSNHILKLFVKDRYNNNHLGKALVKGFGPIRGAIATTIAHDSHNIIAIGDAVNDVQKAMNMVIENKGGISFVSGDVIEFLPLPVAGLMSNESANEVSEQYERILKAVKLHGCVLNSPLMTLSFLALLVIPSLKLSDKGLFDVNKFEFTELFFS